MTTFDRYLLRRFLHTFVILFVTLFGLYVVIDGFTNVDGFQEGTDDALVVLRRMGAYYVYQSSMLFDLMGPTVAVMNGQMMYSPDPTPSPARMTLGPSTLLSGSGSGMSRYGIGGRLPLRTGSNTSA